MRVVVTGADGFVGRGVVQRLHAGGAEVVAASRATTGDLLAHPDLSGLLAGATHVVHLAARVHRMREDAADPMAAHRAMNVDVTRHVAQQAVRAGVRRFLYLSSVKALGETGSFTEASTPQPADAYGRSKLEAEEMLRTLARETRLEVVIVRPPLVYGPGVGANMRSLLRAVHRGLPLPLGAARANRRSLVARANLADLIATALAHDAAANETFHVSDGEDLSTAELVERLATALGVRARLVPVPAALLRVGATLVGRGATASRLLDSLQLDITKARKRLGWQPPVSVDAALREMAQDWVASDEQGAAP